MPGKKIPTRDIPQVPKTSLIDFLFLQAQEEKWELIGKLCFQTRQNRSKIMKSIPVPPERTRAYVKDNGEIDVDWSWARTPKPKHRYVYENIPSIILNPDVDFQATNSQGFNLIDVVFLYGYVFENFSPSAKNLCDSLAHFGVQHRVFTPTNPYRLLATKQWDKLLNLLLKNDGKTWSVAPEIDFHATSPYHQHTKQADWNVLDFLFFAGYSDLEPSAYALSLFEFITKNGHSSKHHDLHSPIREHALLTHLHNNNIAAVHDVCLILQNGCLNLNANIKWSYKDQAHPKGYTLAEQLLVKSLEEECAPEDKARLNAILNALPCSERPDPKDFKSATELLVEEACKELASILRLDTQTTFQDPSYPRRASTTVLFHHQANQEGQSDDKKDESNAQNTLSRARSW